MPSLESDPKVRKLKIHEHLTSCISHSHNNKEVCLTGKDHFIEFCEHSGMVNTRFKALDFF